MNIKTVIVMIVSILVLSIFEASADYFRYMYWMYKNNHLNFFWYSVLSDIFSTLFLSSLIVFICYIGFVLKDMVEKYNSNWKG